MSSTSLPRSPGASGLAGGRGEETGFDIGFCWVFPGTEPEEGLARLKECGFEGIELWPDRWREWGTARWAKALEATGMRCLQLCPYFDFMGGAASLERSCGLLQEVLSAAEALGCGRIRAFTGPPWGKGVVGPREATMVQWSDAVAGLREFCEAAEAYGSRRREICLECHAGSLMEDAPSTLRLLKEIARANLTVNLQLPLRDEAWETSLAALASHTTHIHIHNWTEGLDRGELTFLGEGVFDWKPVLRALLREGHGPGRLALSVEHAEHGNRHDPWETARRDGPYLRALRGELLAELSNSFPN